MIIEIKKGDKSMEVINKATKRRDFPNMLLGDIFMDDDGNYNLIIQRDEGDTYILDLTTMKFYEPDVVIKDYKKRYHVYQGKIILEDIDRKY